ncbi:MAG: acetate kinase [Coriobacteriaceae bacterium]|jgi:acetate kinase|uniref:acetate/propionate family kinase n=1 Tax=Olsenella TaxID=133925 RepID=UPI000FF32F49|nr:acetate kinase [Atopobium sp.]MCH4081025.1 acetate kinase [Atopobiaceae bacterium]RRF94555.1 MAG: acetate kinase [Coriobacteriaceae bacterium]MCI1344169.1 acetate kinase [Atopobiaceae bacterium]MCI1498140.1 acetate kinase [Atopobiaceae bacterium]
MIVLVINAGSSSLKYQLLDTKTREVYAKGNCERIGIDGSFIGHEERGGEKQKLEVALPDHKTAVKHVFDILAEAGFDTDKIQGIGHRVVQGGWYFPESKVVTDETLSWVREVAPLAPLHNYAEADVIEICREMFPSIGNVIVADTSFHYNMPEKAWRYALPRDVVDKLHIRKYGAHGTSHRYIWKETSEFLKGDVHKLVSCHLGSGASLSAIEDGHDMDTTMGLTPLDGLIMGTRCGTIDPATVCYLQRVGGYSVDEVDTMMNKQSGLLALSGVSSDSRDIEAGAEKGDKNCQMALEMFYYRTSQLIAEMAQSMHGFDTMVFTAGIGENSAEMRYGVAHELEWLGVKIDPEKNAVRSGDPRIISTDDSSVKVLVVPTNEELMIALDVEALLG